LTFVREPTSLSDGDYSRASNQQLLLKAFADQALSGYSLKLHSNLNEVVDCTSEYEALGEEFAISSILGLGTSMTSVRSGDITSFTLPTTGTGRERGGQSVVYVDWDELENVRERFKNDDLADYQPAPY